MLGAVADQLEQAALAEERGDGQGGRRSSPRAMRSSRLRLTSGRVRPHAFPAGFRAFGRPKSPPKRLIPVNSACSPQRHRPPGVLGRMSPSSSSMRRRRLYLAVRSERQGAPVLICPELVATARSAMRRVLGLARAMTRHRRVARVAMRHLAPSSRVSLSVPIWLTFTSTELAMPFGRCPRPRSPGWSRRRSSRDDLDASRTDARSVSCRPAVPVGLRRGRPRWT